MYACMHDLNIYIYRLLFSLAVFSCLLCSFVFADLDALLFGIDSAWPSALSYIVDSVPQSPRGE